MIFAVFNVIFAQNDYFGYNGKRVTVDDFVFSYAGCDRQSHNTAAHSHRGWELLYIAAGRCRIRFSTGDEFTGIPGDVFLIPPHLQHERSNMECCRTIYAVFEYTPAGEQVPRKISTGKDHLLKQWFDGLPELNKIYEPIQTASLLRTILLRLEWIESQQKENNDIHPAVKIGCMYMASSLEEPIQIGDIARRAGVSQSHFNMLFRKEFGIGPSLYLKNMRMKLARHLLLNPYHNVSEVAQQCGFRSIHYFTRCFTAFHGVPPGIFRCDPARFADMENQPQENRT